MRPLGTSEIQNCQYCMKCCFLLLFILKGYIRLGKYDRQPYCTFTHLAVPCIGKFYVPSGHQKMTLGVFPVKVIFSSQMNTKIQYIMLEIQKDKSICICLHIWQVSRKKCPQGTIFLSFSTLTFWLIQVSQVSFQMPL